MRVAAPTHEGRISPVMDVAQRFMVVEFEDAREVERREVTLWETDPVARFRQIAKLEWDVLICGAISRSLQTMITSLGVQVIGNTCGPVDDVIGAYREGRLSQSAFLMPGCGGRGRGRRRRYRGGLVR